jgi:uncharacterized membrane protein (DUF4010 family)
VFYLLFSFLSNYAEKNYGESGINWLSVLAGFADVDAFVMNLVQGKFEIANLFIAFAVLQVTTANNFIKMIYCLVLSEKKTKRLALIGFGCILAVNVCTILFARH